MIIGAKLGHFPDLPVISKQTECARGFKIVGFLNWAHTVNAKPDSVYRPVNFSDLPQKTGGRYYSGQKWSEWAGIPIETQIDTANKLGASGWFQIPHTMTDEAIEQFVETVIDGCDHRPVFEFSNEVWNSQFMQYHELAANGSIAGADLEPLKAALLVLSSETIKLRSIVQDRGDVVLCGQLANVWILEFMLQNSEVSNYIDAIAVAVYYQSSEQIDGILRRNLEVHKELADKHGNELWVYEFGSDIRGTRVVDINRSWAAYGDYDKLITIMKNTGVKRALAYSTVSKYIQTAEYGRAFGLYESSSGDAVEMPKMAAIRKHME